MAAITIVRIGRAYASVKTPSSDAAGGSCLLAEWIEQMKPNGTSASRVVPARDTFDRR